jgi:hypothetical protein
MNPNDMHPNDMAPQQHAPRGHGGGAGHMHRRAQAMKHPR